MATRHVNSIILFTYIPISNCFHLISSKDLVSLDNETAAASYEKARDMLRKTIKSLASLWQQPVRGVVEVVYADKSSYTVDYRYDRKTIQNTQKRMTEL